MTRSSNLLLTSELRPRSGKPSPGVRVAALTSRLAITHTCGATFWPAASLLLLGYAIGCWTGASLAMAKLGRRLPDSAAGINANAEMNEGSDMSTLSLALITITVIVAVMVATRPAPRRTRSADQSATGESDQSADPLPATHPSESKLALDRAHRNQWDRRDLAIGVGRDDQARWPALLLWPAPNEIGDAAA